MKYSSSLEKLWKFNQKSPDMLIAKIRRCFKGIFEEDIFEKLATKIYTQRDEAAREILLHSLKTSPDKDIVIKRLSLTVFLDENSHKSKIKKQEANIINANKLAAEQEWYAAEKLLLSALKEEESELYLEALKSIYRTQQRYTDESRIHNQLLSLKSSPLKSSQQLEGAQAFDLMPSVHDLEYIKQASQSLAPLEEQETLAFAFGQDMQEDLSASQLSPSPEVLEFSVVETVSAAVLEPELELEIELEPEPEPGPKPEPETAAEPKMSQQPPVRLESWFDEELDEEVEVDEADEAEALPMDLFAEVDDEDDYETSYIVDDDEHNNEAQQPDIFEDELYFYQFDPDELLSDNDSLPTEITSTARITREERALQKASEFVGKFDWPHSSLPLLKSVFYLRNL